MCEHPIQVKENVSVGKVSHLLLRYRINGILIVEKNNENRLIGIFTTTDLSGSSTTLSPKGRTGSIIYASFQRCRWEKWQIRGSCV